MESEKIEPIVLVHGGKRFWIVMRIDQGKSRGTSKVKIRINLEELEVFALF
jgi:hypothetical protein